MNISEIIKVLVENCPNEAIALFLSTYGVFIIAIVMIVITLVKAIKKTGSFKDLSTSELNKMKKAIELITDNAAQVAVDNQNATNEIKEEIRANNDSMMQLMISVGMANGMSYTDIMNIINKAKDVYEVSKNQYNELENEVKNRVAIENEEKVRLAAEQKEIATSKVETLSLLKIGE